MNCRELEGHLSAYLAEETAPDLRMPVFFALLVLVVTHILQSRHDPVLFAGRYLLVPAFTVLLVGTLD